MAYSFIQFAFYLFLFMIAANELQCSSWYNDNCHHLVNHPGCQFFSWKLRYKVSVLSVIICVTFRRFQRIIIAGMIRKEPEPHQRWCTLPTAATASSRKFSAARIAREAHTRPRIVASSRSESRAGFATISCAGVFV